MCSILWGNRPKKAREYSWTHPVQLQTNLCCQAWVICSQESIGFAHMSRYAYLGEGRLLVFASNFSKSSQSQNVRISCHCFQHLSLIFDAIFLFLMPPVIELRPLHPEECEAVSRLLMLPNTSQSAAEIAEMSWALQYNSISMIGCNWQLWGSNFLYAVLCSFLEETRHMHGALTIKFLTGLQWWFRFRKLQMMAHKLQTSNERGVANFIQFGSGSAVMHSLNQRTRYYAVYGDSTDSYMVVKSQTDFFLDWFVEASPSYLVIWANESLQFPGLQSYEDKPKKDYHVIT